MLKPALASLLVAASLPAASMTFTEDFTGFTTNVESFQAGGDQSQVITDTIGMSQAGVPAIDGTSIFMTIDTTNVNPVGSGSYGGGIRTTLSDPVNPGDLSSATASDYNLIFDVAANGFAPNNVDIFMAFRDSSNANLFPQVGINQNNANFAPFVALMGASNNPVSVSLSLTDLGVTDGQAALLTNVDNIQFQFFTRSTDANYSADAGNVLVLDNVGIELVPEPASLALLGLGSVLLVGRRRSA